MKIKVRVIQASEYNRQLEVTDAHETLIYEGDDALAFYDEMPYEANVELCKNGEVEYVE